MASEMESVETQNARQRLFELGFSQILPRALYVAAELGIADQLSDGPRSVEQIAQAVDAHAPSLRRILRLLVKHDIFGEDEEGRLRLTPISRWMQTDAPSSLKDFLRFDSETLWNAYGNLLHTATTGEPSFNHLNGFDFFQYLTDNPEAAMRADRSQRSLSEVEEKLVAGAYDFSPYGTVVDVGGGRGGMLAEILKAHEGPRGILIDQPYVVSQAERLEGLRDRCEVIAGDFFDAVPEGGDVYLLKRVLHDWDDEPCLRILKKIHGAMADTGRLLVIEGVIDAADPESLVKECDVVIMTFLGGRVRNRGEFADLFEAAGFKLTTITPVTSLVSILEAERA